MRTYSSVRSLRMALGWLLGASALLALVAGAFDLAEIRLLDRAIAGLPATAAETSANDARQSLIEGIQLVMLIATGIVFIVWLHRAYTNLRALGAKKLRFGPGWAIGGWFVPIWSAFRPKQIVNDVWRGSDPELAKSYGNIWDRPVPGWWMIWWLLWGIPFSVGIFFLPLAGDPTSPQELRVAAIGDVVGQALVVVTAVLAVLIVGAVTRRQDERATRAFRARASRRSRGRTRASLG